MTTWNKIISSITTLWTKTLVPGYNVMSIIYYRTWDDTQVWEDDKIWWDAGKYGTLWTKL